MCGHGFHGSLGLSCGVFKMASLILSNAAKDSNYTTLKCTLVSQSIALVSLNSTLVSLSSVLVSLSECRLGNGQLFNRVQFLFLAACILITTRHETLCFSLAFSYLAMFCKMYGLKSGKLQTILHSCNSQSNSHAYSEFFLEWFPPPALLKLSSSPQVLR